MGTGAYEDMNPVPQGSMHKNPETGSWDYAGDLQSPHPPQPGMPTGPLTQQPAF